MKTILLPTDFSQNAYNAMKYAVALFQNQACRFVLLNAYYATPPSIENLNINYIEPIDKYAEEQLGIQLQKIKSLEHHAHSTFEKSKMFGEITNVVEEAANDVGADYIVMGTKGATGLAEVLMGSNTFSVIKKVSCPVICVPENANCRKPKKMVFATDYHTIENTHVLEPLKRVARTFDSEIFIVNVKDKETPLVTAEEAEEGLALHGYLDEIPHHFDFRNTENIEDGIQEYASEINADMICMLKRERTFWEQLFSKSITKKLAFHTDIPLLILHEPHK